MRQVIRHLMVLIQICMWETHLTNHDPAIQVQAIQDFFFGFEPFFEGNIDLWTLKQGMDQNL